MLSTILLVVSLAAPGDAVYVIKGTPVVLTSAQKTELASAVAAEFPTVPPATLDRYYCFANPPAVPDRLAIDISAVAASMKWSCTAVDGNPTLTDQQALDLEIASESTCRVQDQGSSSALICNSQQMSEDGKTLNGAFTQSVFSLGLNLIWDLRCERNPDDASEISCLANRIKVNSPAQWRTDRKAGIVLGTIGKSQ